MDKSGFPGLSDNPILFSRFLLSLADLFVEVPLLLFRERRHLNNKCLDYGTLLHFTLSSSVIVN